MIISVVIEPSLNVNAFIHSINKKLDKQMKTWVRLKATGKWKIYDCLNWIRRIYIQVYALLIINKRRIENGKYRDHTM